MFCPNCGQQQVSEQIRFCSRCGFTLDLIQEILANNGTLPEVERLRRRGFNPTRRQVFIFGLMWLLIVGLFLTSAAAVLLDKTFLEDRIVPLIALLGFIGGPIIMLCSTFFQSTAQLKSNALMSNKAQNQFGANPMRQALPPQSADFNQAQNSAAYVPPQSVPVNQNSWRDAQTGELITPSSVTEGTTKLLDKNE